MQLLGLIAQQVTEPLDYDGRAGRISATSEAEVERRKIVTKASPPCESP
jgi:hypothetical protein